MLVENNTSPELEIDSSARHAIGCGCQACCDSSEAGEPQNHALLGGKWGPSCNNGTFGGVVTWSVVDAGLADLVNSFLTNKVMA